MGGSQIQILIVSMDPDLRARLNIGLAGTGFGCRLAESLHELTEAARDELPNHIDLLILDLDAIAPISRRVWGGLRAGWPQTRVLGLVSQADDALIESLFAAGISGLLPREATVEDLSAAAQLIANGGVSYAPEFLAWARRIMTGPEVAEQMRFGGLSIDLEERGADRWGHAIEHSPLQYALLERLALARGRPVSSDTLLKDVWGTSRERGGTLAQVKNGVRRLREKIEPTPLRPRYLRSTRGWGYYLVDPGQFSGPEAES